MSDRLTGLITIIVALAFFAGATQLEEAPFFADPMGPKVFPMLISSIGLLAGMVLLLRPDEEPNWPQAATIGRLFLAMIVLVFYAYSLKPLGFLASTALAASTLSIKLRQRR